MCIKFESYLAVLDGPGRMNCIFFLVLVAALAILEVKTLFLTPVAGTVSGPLAAMLASILVGVSVAVESGNGGGSSWGELWAMALSDNVVSLGKILVGAPVIPSASL